MMRQSVRFGRVAGIDIGAHWSVLVIAVFLGYGLFVGVLPAGAPNRPAAAYLAAALIVAVLFLAGLLAHELAHALVARHYRVGVRRITLWLLGGVSELEDEAPTPRAELAIAGAGPLTSLVIGGVAAGLAFLASLAQVVDVVVVSLAWLAGVNVILGVFNLLPGAPLDGGRVLRAIVWKVKGDRDAAQVVADRAGMGVGVVLGALGLVEILFGRNYSGLWLVLLGWFLISAAAAEGAGVRVHRALDRRTVRDIMVAEPVCGYDYQSVDSFATGTAAQHRHREFPVVDLDRRLVGLVQLAQLGRVPAELRSTTRLGDIATPASALPVVRPDQPAREGAAALRRNVPLVAVVDNGRLVGVFGASDVSRTVELAPFGDPNTMADSRF